MEKRICLALDNLSRKRAIELCTQLGPELRAAKLHDLLDAHGPSINGSDLCDYCINFAR